MTKLRDLSNWVKGSVIEDISRDPEVAAYKITLKDGRILSLFEEGCLLFKDEAGYEERLQAVKNRAAEQVRALAAEYPHIPPEEIDRVVEELRKRRKGATDEPDETIH